MSVIINKETGLAEDLPNDQALKSLTSGTHEIPMVDPDGNEVSVPYADAAGLLAEGYKQPDSGVLHGYLRHAKYGSPVEQAKTFLEGAGKDATFGLSTAAERAFGVKPEDIQGRREENPVAHGLGSAAGLVGSSLLLPGGGAAGALTKAGEGAAELAGLGGATGFLGKVGASGVKLGAESSLLQSGDEASKYFSGDPNQTAESIISDIGLSAALGGVGGAGLSAVGQGAKLGYGKLASVLNDIKGDASGSPNLFKKTLSALGGVPEKEINAYLENREAIRALPEHEEVFGQLLDHVQGVHDAVASGKMESAEAKEVLKQLEKQAKYDLSKSTSDASRAASDARSMLKTAQTQLKINLRQGAVDAGEQVATAASSIRKQAIEGSQGALKILEDSGKELSLEPVYKKIEALKSDAEAKVDNKLISELDKYKEDLKSTYGDDIHAADAKKVIQGLDERGGAAYNFSATHFEKSVGQKFNQLRYALDDSLKEAVPEYREAMKPVAKDFKLLSDLHGYGEAEGAARKLKGLNNPVKYKYDMPALRELESRTGGSFVESLEKYASPERRTALESALPELETANKTASVLDKLKDPETFKSMQEELANSPEATRLSKAEVAFEAANRAKDELNKITPNTLAGKLKAAGRGDLGAIDQVGSLPDVNGQNPADVMKLMRTKEAFQKTAQSGSRNVNLFGILGGAAGSVFGHPIAGASLGANLGAMVDKFGPQVVQKILDAYLDRLPVGSLAGVTDRGALRLGLAKMLDQSGEVSAAGFKSMVTNLAASMRGDAMATKSAKALVAGQPTKIDEPSERETAKLKDRVNELSKDTSQLLNQSQDVGAYMPEHSTALAAVSLRAVNYLSSLKPNTEKMNPLDPEPVANPVAEANYERQLKNAQQPLLTIQRIKDGSIIPDDVKTIAIIYPSLYSGLKSKLLSAVTEAASDGKVIPYATKMGISLFTGQHLDTTMTSQGMQAIAMANAPQASPPTQQGGGKPKGSMKALDKTAQSYQTAFQANAANSAKA